MLKRTIRFTCVLFVMLFFSNSVIAGTDNASNNFELLKQEHIEIPGNSIDYKNIDKIKKQINLMFLNDQKLRNKLTELSLTLSADDRIKFEKLSWKFVSQIDQQHTEELRKILTHYDWLTISKFDKQTSHHAWVLVQHSLELEFQKNILNIMSSHINTDYIIKEDYALLFDRIAIQEGNPQRYGSQLYFNDEKELIIYPLEDRGNIDNLRKKMNLEPINEYLKKVKKNYGVKNK